MFKLVESCTAVCPKQSSRHVRICPEKRHMRRVQRDSSAVSAKLCVQSEVVSTQMISKIACEHVIRDG